jgi:hypothetical protein
MKNESNDRFDELIGATDRVAPRADFADRVMDAVGRSSDPNIGFFGDLPRVAKRVVPFAVIAAAAAAFFAYRAATQADDAALVAPSTEQIVVGAIEPPTETSEDEP